jgi:sensor histidine kinase YesM
MAIEHCKRTINCVPARKEIILSIFFLFTFCSSFGNKNQISKIPVQKPIMLIDSLTRIALATEKFDFNFEKKIKTLINDTSKWLKSKEFTFEKLVQNNEIFIIQKIPNIKFKNPALLVSFHTNGFQIYIDGKHIYSYGILSHDSVFRYFNTVLIPLDSNYCNEYLVFRAHYDKFLQLGNITNFMIGSCSDLSKLLTDTHYRLLTHNLHEDLGAIIQIIIGLISLFIFFIRWQRREYVFLFFSIFSISSGIMLSMNFMEQLFNASFNVSYYLDTISSFLIPVGFLGFIMFITNSPRKSLINYALWLSIVITVGSVFYPFILPLNYFFWATVGIYLFVAIRSLYLAKLHKEKSFRLPLISLIILFLSIVHDFLLNFKFHILPFGLYTWATLILIMAFGYYIESHYRETSNKMKNYSFELEKTRNYLLNLEKENLLTQYEVLKNQVNPHFLFNSLNTLSSLIRTKPGNAVRFVEEFADLYRYVLDVHDKYVIEIQKELGFIESYIYLQKIRYGDNLDVRTDVESNHLKNLVMPLSLQILIENAIKHNEISEKFPLKINILSDNDFIVVTNKIKLIENRHSNGLGLKNLKLRYEGITDLVPEFYVENNTYIAKIPIIKAD